MRWQVRLWYMGCLVLDIVSSTIQPSASLMRAIRITVPLKIEMFDPGPANEKSVK